MAAISTATTVSMPRRSRPRPGSAAPIAAAPTKKASSAVADRSAPAWSFAGEPDAEKHGVAGHVRRKDVAEPEIADRVHARRDDRQQDKRNVRRAAVRAPPEFWWRRPVGRRAAYGDLSGAAHTFSDVSSLTVRAHGPASASDVWEAYADPQRWPEWAPHIRRVEADGPAASGAHRTGVVGRSRASGVRGHRRRRQTAPLVVARALGPLRMRFDHGVDAATPAAAPGSPCTDPCRCW